MTIEEMQEKLKDFAYKRGVPLPIILNVMPIIKKDNMLLAFIWQLMKEHILPEVDPKEIVDKL